jgi:hypothetical protein
MAKIPQIELEYEYEGEVFWQKQCIKEGCNFTVCNHLSDKFCYPHSAWYRPLMRIINLILTKIYDK